MAFFFQVHKKCIKNTKIGSNCNFFKILANIKILASLRKKLALFFLIIKKEGIFFKRSPPPLAYFVGPPLAFFFRANHAVGKPYSQPSLIFRPSQPDFSFSLFQPPPHHNARPTPIKNSSTTTEADGISVRFSSINIPLVKGE